MSVKYFCDGCGNEIGRNYVARRLMPEWWAGGARFTAEVKVAVNGTWNSGHLCRACLLLLLSSDEPKNSAA